MEQKKPTSVRLKVTGNVKPAETVKVEVETGNFISQDDPQDTIALTLINKNDNSEFGISIWNEKEMRDETKEIPLAVQVKKEDWAKALCRHVSGNSDLYGIFEHTTGTLSQTMETEKISRREV